MHTECVPEQGKRSAAEDFAPVLPGMPDFGSLTFEDAIRLFKQRGFQVEPGPSPEEVTLILEGPDYRNCPVHDARDLPAMAAVALRVRWQNGLLTGRRDHQHQAPRWTDGDRAGLVC